MAACKRCGKPAQFMSDLCSECMSRSDATRWADDQAKPQTSPFAVGSQTATGSSRTSSPILTRYRDAYRVAAALVGVGNGIKIVGAILAGMILLGSLSSGSGMFGNGPNVVGMFVAAVVGVLGWVGGAIVSAQGQILRATLDNAVAHSPFLNDEERLAAMGLTSGLAVRG